MSAFKLPHLSGRERREFSFKLENSSFEKTAPMDIGAEVYNPEAFEYILDHSPTTKVTEVRIILTPMG